jgi:hypothetical protein
MLLAVPALAQVARVGEEGQLQPAERLQVTQNLTVAVCGASCDCAAGLLLTKVSAPCDITLAAGQCNIGSGECCVCTTN